MQANDLPENLRIPAAFPLDAKAYVVNRDYLKDFGENNNLVFSYYKGLRVYCANTKEIYEWMPTEEGNTLSLVELPESSAYVYPDNYIVNNIDYSNTEYKFFRVPQAWDIANVGDGAPILKGFSDENVGTLRTVKGEDGIRVYISESGNELVFSVSSFPTYVNPSLSLGNNAGTREIGETFNLVLTSTFSRGGIYGLKEDGVWNKDAFQNPRAGLPTKHIIDSTEYVTNSLTQSKTLASYKVLATQSFNSQVYFSEGPQPTDSSGSNFESPLPAGNLSASTSFNGSLRWFAGPVSSAPTTGAQVRSTLLSSSAFLTGNSFSFLTGTTNKIFIIAVPNTKTVTQVKNLGTNENLNFSIVSGITTVPDAGGDNQNYKVYKIENSVPFNSSYTLQVTLS